MSLLLPIPDNTWIGTTNVSELAPLVVFDPRVGYNITRRWVGTPTAISGLQIVFDAQKRKHEVVRDDPGQNWEIHAFYGAQDTQPPSEPLANLWELTPNFIEKSLWTLPSVVAETSRIMAANDEFRIHFMNLFRGALEGYVRGERDYVDADGVINHNGLTLSFLRETATDPNLGLAWEPFRNLIYLMIQGIESYQFSAYVLRHTLTVPSNTSLTPSYANVGKQYSSTSLVGSESIPTAILGQIDSLAGFWLKQTPSAQQITYDKFTLTQEFWWSQSYSTYIYGAPL